MLPSRRTYVILLVGLAVAMAASNWVGVESGLVLTLIFDAIVLILGLIDGRLTIPHKVIAKRLPVGKLSIGRDNPIQLEFQTNRPAQLIVCDQIPLDWGILPRQPILHLTLTAPEVITYQVHPQRRGKFAWGNIQVRQLGNWGLMWLDWRVPAAEQVAVYPDLIGLRHLTIKLTLENSGSLKRSRRLGIGTEFAELRDYRSGDDPRMIDWKATARKTANQVPAVRVLEPEQEQTLIILLDRGRLMTAYVQGLTRFDWGLNATLALALAGTHRGDQVGVGVFDQKIHTWIAPQRGQTHLNHLIETLTPIQPALVEPDYVGTVSHLIQQQSRRALIVLITDLVDATASRELLVALGSLTPRYLPFCVMLRDPYIDRQSSSTIADLKEAYQQAIALDMINQRQLALARLKQKGVLVLDAPANQISNQLVERYLQLKTQNLL